MDRESELKKQSEIARAKLLSLPPETVVSSFSKEPGGLLVLTLLSLPLVAIPYGVLSAFLPFDLPGGIGLASAPICVAVWVAFDNDKKYRQNQKRYKTALPTTIAREYCRRFDTKDKLWNDMDYLWREGERRTRNWLAGEVLKKFDEPQ